MNARRATRSPAPSERGHFLAAVQRAQLPAVMAFADGVRRWRAELLAYSTNRPPTAMPKRVINKVTVIKRRAYGLPNFNGFRERVLLACA